MLIVDYAKVLGIFIILTVALVVLKEYLRKLAAKHYQKNPQQSIRFWLWFYIILGTVLVLLAISGVFAYEGRQQHF